MKQKKRDKEAEKLMKVNATTPSVKMASDEASFPAANCSPDKVTNSSGKQELESSNVRKSEKSDTYPVYEAKSQRSPSTARFSPSSSASNSSSPDHAQRHSTALNVNQMYEPNEPNLSDITSPAHAYSNGILTTSL